MQVNNGKPAQFQNQGSWLFRERFVDTMQGAYLCNHIKPTDFLAVDWPQSPTMTLENRGERFLIPPSTRGRTSKAG